MAITASCSVNYSIVTNDQRVSVVLAVTNTGGSDVNVTAIQPVVVPSSNNSARNVALPVNSSVTVSAGGTRYFSWDDTFRVNLQEGVGQFSYAVGAVVSTSDGAQTAASQATVQVIPPQTTSPIQPGAQPYTPSAGPLPASTEGAPLPGEPPNLPVAGQARFESNVNSGLIAAML